MRRLFLVLIFSLFAVFPIFLNSIARAGLLEDLQAEKVLEEKKAKLSKHERLKLEHEELLRRRQERKAEIRQQALEEEQVRKEARIRAKAARRAELAEKLAAKQTTLAEKRAAKKAALAAKRGQRNEQEEADILISRPDKIDADNIEANIPLSPRATRTLREEAPSEEQSFDEQDRWAERSTRFGWANESFPTNPEKTEPVPQREERSLRTARQEWDGTTDNWIDTDEGTRPPPREEVTFETKEAPGTIIINTSERRLYFVLDHNRAIRYGIGVGRPGFEWMGVKSITRKEEWPDWRPPDMMIERRPDLPRYMPGGPTNPLGARAMYLGSTLYRIHGSNEPETIGHAVSSGCFRMVNADVIDLYERTKVGAKVIVR
jgi:lipoprotein-anchoring transpeptidase ErfK/SrfK